MQTGMARPQRVEDMARVEVCYGRYEDEVYRRNRENDPCDAKSTLQVRSRRLTAEALSCPGR
jgi:hypothetical protein